MVMNRKLILIIGAQRSGKSYFSNELIKKYLANGNSAIVYNLGKQTDFNAAKEVFLLTEKQHIVKLGKNYKENPEFLFYEYNGKDLMFKNFCNDFSGKAIKTSRLDYKSEVMFLDALYKYVSNCLLVIDDAKAIFRYGIKAEFLTLFSRLNHTGRHNPIINWQSAGSDVVVIFHSLDHINKDLFDFCTHIINFKYAIQPDFDKIENTQLKEQLKKSFNALNKAPQYSYTITDVHNLKTKIFINN